jgi:hypothetical protein
MAKAEQINEQIKDRENKYGGVRVNFSALHSKSCRL